MLMILAMSARTYDAVPLVVVAAPRQLRTPYDGGTIKHTSNHEEYVGPRGGRNTSGFVATECKQSGPTYLVAFTEN